MRIGITGHQKRDGISWDWVAEAIEGQIKLLSGVEEALSSLAVGSDQVFAEAVLKLQIPLVSVIPIPEYRKLFKAQDLLRYETFLKRSQRVIEMPPQTDDERSFLEAGRYVVDQSDRMFAVWDGKDAEGEGGTGDVVHYAMKKHTTVTHIDPVKQTVVVLHA